MSADAGDYGILDEVDGIGGPGVFGLAVVVVVGDARLGIEGYVLEYAAEAQGVPDLGLVLFGELDAFGVASALEVEDAVGAPAVFVVADEIAGRIGGERGFSGSGKSEEQGAHAIVADIGRAVHREHMALRQQEIHDAENRLLHLAGIGCAADQISTAA